MTIPANGSRRMPAGLIALTLGSFGIGLTEFVIAGPLPQVSLSLAVSEAAAGWLISGYALSVAVGAIVVTAATSGLSRKSVLIGLVALFVAGNLLSAVASDYPVMLLGRVARPCTKDRSCTPGSSSCPTEKGKGSRGIRGSLFACVP
ncbi:MFS transporter [Nonomuraea sp. NPDC052116]|uniref:MFS transporter n=1 Tax=Nonomuraea sp. NPDC052116 TaxID=3155665 RepID=UPI003441EC97